MTKNTKKIFLLEDDLSFGGVLKSFLELNDFDVKWINDGKDAIGVFREEAFDICLLDVMLPNVDGFTVGTQINKISPHIPVIYLTAKSMKEDIIKGYKLGADDYITKPFDTDVLLYKIKAILNRGGSQTVFKEVFELADLTFNIKLRELRKDKIVYKISPKEAEVLQMLCARLNEMVSRDEILLNVWGNNDYFTGRSMDVFISKVRKYLAIEPRIQLNSIHGTGYILAVH